MRISKMLFLPIMLLVMYACSSKKSNEEPVTVNVPKVKKKQLIKEIALASPNDTVCGMPVKHGAADTLLYKGKVYGFCATACKELFIQQLQEEQQEKKKR